MATSKRWLAVLAAIVVFGAVLCGTADQWGLQQRVTEIDHDADGVEHAIEEWFGTADDTDDTDGDGVSDYTEIFELSSDPLVADGEMDSDGDGIPNAQEVALGTSPSKRDTDGDGLADGDEVHYATEPLVYDSDADGVRDGYEVQLGTDPCVPQEMFTVSVADEEVHLDMTLGGEYAETVGIAPTAHDRLFSKNPAGALSQAYDVTVDGTFKSGTVSFALETGCVSPTVYYFNQATQSLEPIETTVQDGVADAVITQTGTYILLDRTVYESSFVWEDRFGLASVYEGLEVVFVIDDSSSMNTTDPNEQRLSVTDDLIGRLPADCRVGMVRFSDEATVLSSPTADREAVKACLTTTHFVSSGTTAFYAGVQTALGLYNTEYDRTKKVMIVLSDGQPIDDALRAETIAQVKEQGIQTYTVALGGTFFGIHQVLEEYTDAVGGTYYTAKTADELTVVYDTLADAINLIDDTDGDGIPDYYEDRLVSFIGIPIELDKTKADTDGDGVPDGEEVKVELVYSDDGTHVYVKGTLLSDPTLDDTDGDGIPDSEDDLPYDNTYTATVTTEYSTSSMIVEMDYTWFFADNTVYNPLLSETSALFTTMAYELSTMRICDAAREESAYVDQLSQLLAYFGMEHPQTYALSTDYTDNDISEVTVGYRHVRCDGALRTVLAVVVRGTNTTIEEWSSNFDIGDLSKDTDTDDWLNTDHHKGFDVAANRIADFVEQYIETHGLYRDQLVYWVSGHSRGAGIANILGANLEKAGKTAFTYTFASPNTTLAKDAASYRTIFNIINEDDFVPCLPSDTWGYSRYGVSTKAVSVRESYESRWETFTGILDYDAKSNLKDYAATIAGVLKKGTDPRVDCYRYTCACHGDGSNDTVTITNGGMTQSSREKAIAKIPANALSSCIITRYDGNLLGGWDFDVCQTPSYFMQLLAAFMGGEVDAYRFAVELDVAPRYESAKSALIEIGVGGVKHPHYPETYCMLAGVLTADAF